MIETAVNGRTHLAMSVTDMGHTLWLNLFAGSFDCKMVPLRKSLTHTLA